MVKGSNLSTGTRIRGKYDEMTMMMMMMMMMMTMMMIKIKRRTRQSPSAFVCVTC